jgi:hypothetical protein
LRKLPTQSHLHEWFDYDPATGVFVWKKVHYSNAKLLGRPAGTRRKSGYIFIGVPQFGQLGAHRLAWIYVHGLTIGGAEVDHEDTDPSNNAIGNLRLATSSQQKQNKKVQSNNRSGLKGAFYTHEKRRGKRWTSRIKVEGKVISLGYFATALEAHDAYAQAAFEYFGEFARAA